MLTNAPSAPLPAPALPITPRRWGRLDARTCWAWARVLGGVAILLVLVWRVGAGGFLAGLRMIDAGTLLLAFGIGVVTTILNAWRWRLVARGLGVRLPLGAAVADYYRAMFLNAALPGGILGDVHRAVRHGRDLRDLGLGVRAVALERLAGQIVLVTTGAVVLLLLGGPVLAAIQIPIPVVATSGLLAIAAVVLACLATRVRRTGSRWARAVRTTVDSVRYGLLDRRLWPGIFVCSALVLVGYVATFLVAARAAGVTAGVAELLPLLILALLAMAIPLSVGGWGPREGVCAWAFGVAGLGAAQGLTVAVIYGVSVFVVSLPGAVVLAHRWRGRRRPAPAAPDPPPAA